MFEFVKRAASAAGRFVGRHVKAAVAVVVAFVGLGMGVETAKAVDPTPVVITIPTVVDWTGSINELITKVGPWVLLVAGCTLAFLVSRRLLRRAGGAA